MRPTSNEPGFKNWREKWIAVPLVTMLHARWGRHGPGRKTDRQLRLEWRLWRLAGWQQPRDEWWGFDSSDPPASWFYWLLPAFLVGLCVWLVVTA